METPSENSPSLKSQLVLAIAGGECIKEWALKNNVPRRTATRWASDPKVRAAAEECRRRYLDMAAGRYAKRVAWAADEINRLAETTEAVPARLAACKAIFFQYKAITEYTTLEARMVKLEEQARDRTGNKNFKG